MSKAKVKKYKQYSITPVPKLPEGQRLRESFYDKILEDIESNETGRIFKVEIPDKSYKSIYASFDIRILKHGLHMRIRIANKTLYIEKLTQEEYDKYLEDRKLRGKRRPKEKA